MVSVKFWKFQGQQVYLCTLLLILLRFSEPFFITYISVFISCVQVINFLCVGWFCFFVYTENLKPNGAIQCYWNAGNSKTLLFITIVLMQKICLWGLKHSCFLVDTYILMGNYRHTAHARVQTLLQNTGPHFLTRYSCTRSIPIHKIMKLLQKTPQDHQENSKFFW